MQAFDEHMNLVLGEVEESHTVNDRDPVTGEEIVQVRIVQTKHSIDNTCVVFVVSIAISLEMSWLLLFTDKQAHDGNVVCAR
jgi:hypothetical protein